MLSIEKYANTLKMSLHYMKLQFCILVLDFKLYFNHYSSPEVKSPKKKIGICDLPMPPMSDEMDEDADYGAKVSAMGKQDNYKSCTLTSLKNTYVYGDIYL